MANKMAKYKGEDVTVIGDLTADDKDFGSQFDPNNPKVVIQDDDGKKAVPKSDLKAD